MAYRRYGGHETGNRLLELTRFDSPEAADALTKRTYHIFAAADPHLAHLLGAALAEVTSNVLEHSRQPYGFVALQQYGAGCDQQVALAVGDSGVGLRATLSTVVPCPTDAKAVDLATERRVSAQGADAGVGLHSVVEIACGRGGDVRLWSGTAFGVIGSPGGPSVTSSPPGSLRGTVAYARLPV